MRGFIVFYYFFLSVITGTFLSDLAECVSAWDSAIDAGVVALKGELI